MARNQTTLKSKTFDSKRQRVNVKNIKKPRISDLGRYEGGSYKGGRRAKNLSYSPDGFVYNQFGVEVSLEEKKRLEYLVNTANRKRKRMLERENEMMLFAGGEKLNASVADKTMGRQSDFILVRKSKSLQRFETREQFDTYIQNLEKITDRNYVKQRASMYKDNFIKAMENENYSKDIINSIKDLNIKQFMEVSQTEEFARFGFVYDVNQRKLVIAGIRSAVERVRK